MTIQGQFRVDGLLKWLHPSANMAQDFSVVSKADEVYFRSKEDSLRLREAWKAQREFESAEYEGSRLLHFQF